jgi:RluA family pseudouridine synthase
MISGLPILFEDSDLLVLNKPSGLVSEGGSDGQVDLESLVSDNLGKEVRCCHRLDKLTSGAILLRKNKRFNRELGKMIEGHRLRKTYWAISRGIWPKAINRIETKLLHRKGRTIVDPRGKSALTTVRVLAHDTSNDRSLIELLLKTGRTHQARVHCAESAYPILGDPLYGTGEIGEFFGLHARELKFRHPGTGENITASATPPSNWKPVIEAIGLEYN